MGLCPSEPQQGRCPCTPVGGFSFRNLNRREQARSFRLTRSPTHYAPLARVGSLPPTPLGRGSAPSTLYRKAHPMVSEQGSRRMKMRRDARANKYRLWVALLNKIQVWEAEGFQRATEKPFGRLRRGETPATQKTSVKLSILHAGLFACIPLLRDRAAGV